MVFAASVWPPRIAALVLSTAAAVSVAYWGLHWKLSPQPVWAAIAVGTSQPPLDSAAVARALGAAAAAPDATALSPQASEASRFVLQGVLGHAGAGRALIAVDGKPAKPVRVGAVVAEDWVLRLAEGRRVVLTRHGLDIELALPALSAAATTTTTTPATASPSSTAASTAAPPAALAAQAATLASEILDKKSR
jgi:general secretion pathway protein C